MQSLVWRSLSMSINRNERSCRRIVVMAALLAALLGAGSYQSAQATPKPWTTVQQEEPANINACLGSGTQLPVDPAGGTITIFITVNNGLLQERTPVHQITVTETAAKIDNFCLDILKPIPDNATFCDSSLADDPRLIYLITNYPPDVTNNITQAARQAAVWHFTNNGVLRVPDATTGDAATDAAVIAAYDALVAEVEQAIDPNNPPPLFLPGAITLTVTPTDTLRILPGAPQHDFTLSLTKGGKPLAGITVTVASTFGTLDKTSGVTDANGESAFILSSTKAGTATITATAVVTVPFVGVYISEANPTSDQPFGSNASETENVEAVAAVTWEDPTALDVVEEPAAGHRLYLPMLRD